MLSPCCCARSLHFVHFAGSESVAKHATSSVSDQLTDCVYVALFDCRKLYRNSPWMSSSAGTFAKTISYPWNPAREVGNPIDFTKVHEIQDTSRIPTMTDMVCIWVYPYILRSSLRQDFIVLHGNAWKPERSWVCWVSWISCDRKMLPKKSAKLLRGGAHFQNLCGKWQCGNAIWKFRSRDVLKFPRLQILTPEINVTFHQLLIIIFYFFLENQFRSLQRHVFQTDQTKPTVMDQTSPQPLLHPEDKSETSV